MNIRDEAIIRMYLSELAPKWLVKVLLWMARRHVVEERKFLYVPSKRDVEEVRL